LNPTELRRVIAFESSLKVDDIVSVRWTSAGRSFYARARVSRVNQSSVRVILQEDVARDFHGGYPAGHEIVVPLFQAGPHARWSANNRVEPPEGYPTQAPVV
jgi:hypothetical protein